MNCGTIYKNVLTFYSKDVVQMDHHLKLLVCEIFYFLVVRENLWTVWTQALLRFELGQNLHWW